MNARELVETYGDMLYRICLISLQNAADAEDAVQETLLRLLTKAPQFASEEHRKAWLITVAMNYCKNEARNRGRTIPTEPLLIPEESSQSSDSGIFEALSRIPEKFRIPLYLHYVQGYQVKEISEILHVGVSAIKMRLSKGRKVLGELYRKEYM